MSDLSKQIAELKAKQVEILNEQLKEKVSLIKPLDNPSIESIIQFAETDYLLSSPKNAEMLMKSIEEVKNGNLIEFDPTKD